MLYILFISTSYKLFDIIARWLRFFGLSIYFVGTFSIILALSFFVEQSATDILLTVIDAQNSLFYIPFTWLGLMLSNLFGTAGSSVLLGIVYMFLSTIFICGLYVLAVLLNKRFSLYEPPAIKIQNNIYAPKKSLLSKLGLSNLEAAIIYKDFKTWTRRKELNPVFIFPIFLIVFALFMSSDTVNASVVVSSVTWLVITTSMIFLLPSVIVVYGSGLFSVGQEGEAVWRIYASPIGAKSFVRSKYFFVVFFGLITLAITGVSGMILYRPTITVTSVAVLEAVFLIFALSAISLNFGFRGADFSEFPKARLVRPVWMAISLVVCIFAAFAILAPVALPVLFPIMSSEFGLTFSFPNVNPFIATAVSGIIAAAITVIFYKLTLSDAKNFLRKADV
jgi:hypothetical protein